MSSTIRQILLSRKTGVLLSLLVAALGVAVLIGWALNIQVLKSVFPGLVTMKANTALSMLLSGLAMALLLRDSMGKISRVSIILMSIVVIMLSTLTLGEDLFGWDLGIDQWLFRDKTDSVNMIPGRMGAASAFCFILLGIALLIGSNISSSLRLPIIATMSTGVLIVSGLTLLSHISHIMFGIQFWNDAGMAIHTAVGCIFLGTALLILINNEYKIGWSLDRLTTIVFIVGIVMLLGTAAESYRFTLLLQDNIKRVAHTQKILTESNELLGHLAVLQDGQRGYIITGDEKLLNNRAETKAMVKQDITDIDILIPDDTPEQRHITRIEEIITQRNNWEDETIIAAKQHGLPYAQKMIASGKGIALSDAMTALITELVTKEEAFLAKNQKQANDTSIRTFLLLPLQVFLSMTILSFGLFLLNSGVSDRKRVEEQLRQSQKMEAIGQLTGGVAHDFNNLLSVIIGNLDLLERLVVGNEAAIHRVQTIQKAATRGGELTKRLLTFSRLQKLHPVPTSVENVIQSTIEMASRALGPEITITTKLGESIPAVFVDTAGFENALLNLIVNARDAMANGGPITITTELKTLAKCDLPVRTKELKPGRYVRIAVSDMGCGMSKETMAKVFEPFFTTKPRGKGTGLGLSMVYGFVKQSGGLINIYSELEHGTTISLYLPIAEGVYPDVPAIDKAVSKTHSNGGETVLIVDDEVDLLEVAVVYLEDMGYRVLHATDGPSALAIIAHEGNIDLLITDIIMPGGMNGVQLAARAQQLKPSIKIIYSSGFTSDALSEKSGMKIDAPLLNKPYQRKEFVDMVRRVMG